MDPTIAAWGRKPEPSFIARFQAGVEQGQRIKLLRGEQAMKRSQFTRGLRFKAEQAEALRDFEEEQSDKAREDAFELEEMRIESREKIAAAGQEAEQAERDVRMEQSRLLHKQRIAALRGEAEARKTRLKQEEMLFEQRMTALDVQMTKDVQTIEALGDTAKSKRFLTLTESMRKGLSDAATLGLTKPQQDNIMRGVRATARNLDRVAKSLGLEGGYANSVTDVEPPSPQRDYFGRVFDSIMGRQPTNVNQPQIDALRSPEQNFARDVYRFTEGRHISRDGVPKPPNMAPRDYQALQDLYTKGLLKLREQAKTGKIKDLNELQLHQRILIDQLRKKTQTKKGRK
jgi:hypothetical protein